MTTKLPPFGSDIRGATGVAVEPRKPRPIVWFAVLGACFLVLQLYIFGGWIASGPQATPVGDDEVPLGFKIGPTTFMVLVWSVFAWLLWFKVIKPWRRDGHLSTEGLFVLAIATMVWQDPLANWLQPTFTYNAWLLNFGAWTDYIPGWKSPNGSKLAEPILMTGVCYTFPVFVAFGAFWLVKKLHYRFPATGNSGTVAFFFGAFIALDVLGETAMVRLGIFSYVNPPPEITPFHGHFYQYPIIEPFLFGSVMAGWALLMYFRNDKGETVVERGSAELHIAPRRKTFVRFLAILGAVNAFFLLYNMIWILISSSWGPWIEDVTKRSYFVDQICGAGTSYHCPESDLPIPKGPDSYHVNPHGVLVDGAGRPAAYGSGS